MAKVAFLLAALVGGAFAARMPPKNMSLAAKSMHMFANDCGARRPDLVAMRAHRRSREQFVQQPAQYSMEVTSKNSSSRCKGGPATGWGGLGNGISQEACQQACLDSTECSFAVYEFKTSGCSAFTTCSMTKTGNHGPFAVFAKNEVITTTTTTTTTVVPFVQVLKDGFYQIACVKDVLFYYGDMYGNNKFDYKPNKVSGVSIVHYSEVLAKEDQEEMTHETCFEFCRTVPNMTFFGLIHGRDCYCTPFFEMMADDSSDCDEVCAAKPTQMCGGKTKSLLFEMHQCADVAANLKDANKKAENVSSALSELVRETEGIAEAMQNGAQTLQDQFGQAGDPAAADLFQTAKVFAGELQHAAEDKAKIDAAIAADAEKSSKLANEDFSAYEVNKKAQDLTSSLEKLTAEAEDAVEDLHGLLKLSSPKDEEANASKQYYPLMYFVDKKHDQDPSTCTGDMDKKPMVDVTEDECANACDAAVHTCVGYSYFPSAKFCFLFSKFTEVTYYTGCGKADFLQKNSQPATPKKRKEEPKEEAEVEPPTCYGKLSEFPSSIAPNPSGKCAGCLKKATNAARCYE